MVISFKIRENDLIFYTSPSDVEDQYQSSKIGCVQERSYETGINIQQKSTCPRQNALRLCIQVSTRLYYILTMLLTVVNV